MASIIEQAEIVLLVTAIVGMLARRLRLPTTAGLVVAGLGLALVPGTIDIAVTKELIFDAFLPPLVFEAALHISRSELRKDSAVILTLTILGVLLTASATAAGMHYLLQWNWQAASLFGILIAATDPVSVIATFKEVGSTAGCACCLKQRAYLTMVSRPWHSAPRSSLLWARK